MAEPAKPVPTHAPPVHLTCVLGVVFVFVFGSTRVGMV